MTTLPSARLFFRVLAASAGASVALIAAPVPADARIVCRNDMQRVAGNYISTPYCQDEYVARVAREYGMKASAARVRDNPNYKREVCRLIGNDIRVSEFCMNENPRVRGRAF